MIQIVRVGVLNKPPCLLSDITAHRELASRYAEVPVLLTDLSHPLDVARGIAALQSRIAYLRPPSAGGFSFDEEAVRYTSELWGYAFDRRVGQRDCL